MAECSNSIFYVYEYWRPDKNRCFYVGKGKDGRAYVAKRDHNPRFNAILDTLARIGLFAETRLVQGHLTEGEAFDAERIRIAFWKSSNVSLVNRTNGGSGIDGYVVSAKTRKKIGLAHRGKIVSEATREKLRIASTGKTASAETREKMRVAHFCRTAPYVGVRGRKASDETRLKMSASQKGRTVSVEARLKISKASKLLERSVDGRYRPSIPQSASGV